LGRALLEGADLRFQALQAREVASHGAILRHRCARRVAQLLESGKLGVRREAKTV
jgi:hypothetical protein